MYPNVCLFTVLWMVGSAEDFQTRNRETPVLRILVDDAARVEEIVGKGDKQHRKGIQTVKVYLLRHEQTVGPRDILRHTVH